MIAYLHFRPGMFIYVGPSVATKTHEHHSLQLVIGEAIQFENQDGKIETGNGFLINTDYAHHCDTNGGILLLINIDPESKEAQFWKSTILYNQSYCHIPEPYLSVLQTKVDDLAENKITIQELSKYLASLTGEPQPIDTRIEQAIDILKANQTIGLHQLADEVCLSESRLVHLFKEQIGIPIRQYALWNKLLVAISKLGQYNLTEASHSAGFTDSAHFSKTFSRMFGVSPSLLTKNSQFIQVSVALD